MNLHLSLSLSLSLSPSIYILYVPQPRRRNFHWSPNIQALLRQERTRALERCRRMSYLSIYLHRSLSLSLSPPPPLSLYIYMYIYIRTSAQTAQFSLESEQPALAAGAPLRVGTLPKNELRCGWFQIHWLAPHFSICAPAGLHPPCRELRSIKEHGNFT